MSRHRPSREHHGPPGLANLGGLPSWLLAPALLGVVFILLPVGAIAAGVDVTGGFWALVTSPAALDALGLSLRTALASTACCLVLGVPLAVLLARAHFPGRHAVRALVLLPLVLPPVVGGIALLTTFGRRGVLGVPLAALGIEIPFTTGAVVMAQVFVALPFLVLTVEGAMRSHDTRHEKIAATLGARPTRVLRLVTLPRVAPALASGTVLAFARALGEFGATITFAGALPGVTQTLPLEIYLQRSADPAAAVALSLVLVVVALVIIVAAHGEWVPLLRPGGDPSSAPPEGTGDHDELSANGDAPGAALPGVTPQARSLSVYAEIVSRRLSVDLTVRPGEMVAVIGPNGAGKSTLLDVVAGHLHGQRGDVVRVACDDAILTDSATGIRVPPPRRRVAWLSQRPLLFDNLSVLDNVAFGPRAHGTTRSGAREAARRYLSTLGLAALARRRPATLSGGQAQRVSLARALATRPDVLLLDEPFASLDVTTAQQARAALLSTRSERPCTTLLVTHDLVDVVVLADRVVVLADGRIIEDAPATEVLSRPRSRFAARLAGVNALHGEVDGAGPSSGDASDGVLVGVRLPGRRRVVGVSGDGLHQGRQATAVFEPRSVSVHRHRPQGSPRNTFPVVVTSVEPHGPLLRVWATTRDGVSPGHEVHLAADLTPGAAADLAIGPGERAWFVVKAAEVRVHAR